MATSKPFLTDRGPPLGAARSAALASLIGRLMRGHESVATIDPRLGTAYLDGFVAIRLRLSSIASCPITGAAVGPLTPGLAADCPPSDQWTHEDIAPPRVRTGG